VSGILLFLLAAASNAQSKTDEETVDKLPQSFSEANAILGIPPELQGIRTPFAIPGTEPKPH
jgi:hypothetical protein